MLHIEKGFEWRIGLKAICKKWSVILQLVFFSISYNAIFAVPKAGHTAHNNNLVPIYFCRVKFIYPCLVYCHKTFRLFFIGVTPHPKFPAVAYN